MFKQTKIASPPHHTFPKLGDPISNKQSILHSQTLSSHYTESPVDSYAQSTLHTQFTPYIKQKLHMRIHSQQRIIRLNRTNLSFTHSNQQQRITTQRRFSSLILHIHSYRNIELRSDIDVTNTPTGFTTPSPCTRLNTPVNSRNYLIHTLFLYHSCRTMTRIFALNYQWNCRRIDCPNPLPVTIHLLTHLQIDSTVIRTTTTMELHLKRPQHTTNLPINPLQRKQPPPHMQHPSIPSISSSVR